MSLLTEVPPHDFLLSAKLKHESMGVDFAPIFDYWFTYGYMFKGPDYFIMGGPDQQRSDAWFVWWAEAQDGTFSKKTLAAIAFFLSFMPEYRPYVGWARGLKGRTDIKYFSTDRLHRFTDRR